MSKDTIGAISKMRNKWRIIVRKKPQDEDLVK